MPSPNPITKTRVVTFACAGCGTIKSGKRFIDGKVFCCSFKCQSTYRQSIAESKTPIGEKFGYWQVLAYAHNKPWVDPKTGRGMSRHYWLCKCVCGHVLPVQAVTLKKGASKSCGCEGVVITRGPEYNALSSLRGRCYNPNNFQYPHYGGRGITVCDRWMGKKGPENFYADMGPRPTPKHSIDRINNDGNYEPGNCHWATQLEQMRNTRKTQWVEYHGERRSLIEWCERLNISHKRTDSRLARGWSIEDAFTVPALPNNSRAIGGSISNRKRLYT